MSWFASVDRSVRGNIMHIVKVAGLVFASLCLVGCVTTTPVYLPNGAMGHEISCGGTAGSWSGCLNRAAAICKGPYTIVDRTGEHGIVAWNGGLYGTVSRKIMIVCGARASNISTPTEASSP